MQTLWAFQEIERYAIIAGVNYGGAKRDLLRYAHTDAENMSRVLTDIGGVPKKNQMVLLESTAEAFNTALTDLATRLTLDSSDTRKEVVFYFSGHANENGLFFGNDNYDYRVLRKDIEAIPAELKITVLDACASGAITRMKGGFRKQAFLIDASNDLSGYAFITSSSNNEASQESDSIGGSFFTHYLVSGMRGAADVSQDGKITLGEAYQFAFNETLSRTQNTTGGTQHPSYDMKLSGTGDVVMTDLRESTTSLILHSDLQGRLFVKNSNGQLIAELFKMQGRTIEIGLDDQSYSLYLENGNEKQEARVALTRSSKTIVTPENFSKLHPETTRSRGDSKKSTHQDTVTASQYTVQFGITNNEYHLNGGSQISLFKNSSTPSMSGSQVSLLGYNSGDTIGGMQWAFWGNYSSGTVEMGQMSLFVNRALGPVHGFQIAPFLNTSQGGSGLRLSALQLDSGAFVGLQVGLMQLADSGSITGVQMNALASRMQRVDGLAVSGLVNVADTVNGVQVGGLFNKAEVVRGVQIGAVNISKEMHGVPLGLINYSENGQFTANVWMDELDMQYITIKSGSAHFHTFVTWGRNITHDNRGNALGGGFGFRIGGERLGAELDVHELWVVDKLNSVGDDDDLITKFSLSGDVRAFKYLSIFGGVSYNVLMNFDKRPVVEPWSEVGSYFHRLNKGVYAWPGVHFGLKVGRF